MNKRKVLLGIVGAILVIAGLALGGLAMGGRLPWQKSGDLYKDPQGRFTMQVGAWEQVETDGSYTHFKVENRPGAASAVRMATSPISCK